MNMRKGLSKSQIICIVLLWIALCIMLFTIPSGSSLGEKIFIGIVSGIIIFVGLTKDQSRKRDRNRRNRMSR